MTVFICILAQTPEQTNFLLINVTAHIWNHWTRGRGKRPLCHNNVLLFNKMMTSELFVRENV